MKKPQTTQDIAEDLQLVIETIKDGFKRGSRTEQSLLTLLENAIELIKIQKNMKKSLEKLSKTQLQDCLESVLYWHEKHCKMVSEETETEFAGFFELKGNIISIRNQFDLPPLNK